MKSRQQPPHRHSSHEKQAGASPGTLQYVGVDRDHAVNLTVIRYDQERAEKFVLSTAAEVAALRKPGTLLWVSVNGVHQVNVVSDLAAVFGIHSLAVEDVVATHQRPKAEDHGHFLFFVVRQAQPDESHHDSAQVSIFTGKDFVLTFQETPQPIFSLIESRLLAMQGQLPLRGPDYLTYRLLDSMVDAKFELITSLEEKLEDLQELIVEQPGHFNLNELFHLRRQVSVLKRAATPLRDFVSFFRNLDSELVSRELDIFLLDFGDHVTRTLESVEACREIISSLVDLHVNQSERRMNEIMKVLTVISTIFIPLSFLTGWFGMNFTGMKGEYDNPWAYPVFISVIAVVVGGQLYYFRKKRWI